MHADSSSASRSMARWLWPALLGYFAFVVFGSLVPLDFRALPIDEAFSRFARIPFLNLGIGSRADWVANLLLFIPLAFLASAVIARGGRAGFGVIALVTVLGAGFSVGLEFTQLFFPPRTVSQNDILAETLGALVGALAYRLTGERVLDWSRGFFEGESRVGRARRVLIGYLCVLLAFSVMPLDLSFDLGVLGEKWKRGAIVLIPFSHGGGSPIEAAYELLTDIVIWMPVAWLLALEGLSRRRVVGLTVLAAALVEGAQLFVYTRTTDVTDVVLAGVAALATLPLMARLDRLGLARLERLAGPAAIGWAVVLLGIFWWPFNFDLSLLGDGRVSALADRTLFETYYFTSEYHAINELLRKVGFFLPLGGLWALAGGRRGARRDGGVAGRGRATDAARQGGGLYRLAARGGRRDAGHVAGASDPRCRPKRARGLAGPGASGVPAAGSRSRRVDVVRHWRTHVVARGAAVAGVVAGIAGVAVPARRALQRG